MYRAVFGLGFNLSALAISPLSRTIVAAGRLTRSCQAERLMHLRRPSFSAIAVAVVSGLSTSCSEMAVRVKGRLVDAAGAPRERCLVTMAYRGRTVGEFRVSGAFDQTAVFRPSTAEPLTVRGSCYGTRASFEKEISPGAEKFNNVVDLGNVVLP